MPRITQEDFSPVYMDVRRHDSEAAWPKLVLWALDQPIVYDNMQIMVTVLQKQIEPYGSWTYKASLNVNDHTVATNEESLYSTDPYAEIGNVSTDETYDFDEVIENIYNEIEELQDRKQAIEDKKNEHKENAYV